MKLIPNKTFLLRQDKLSGGKRKDIVAKRGIPIEVTEEEAAKFYGYFFDSSDNNEKEKKKVIQEARAQGYLRMV
jgi:hypothetical protein